jgi:hypothetical protein
MLLKLTPTRGQTIKAKERGSDPAGNRRQSMLDGDVLDIYLSDHFAGATAGLNLAKRMSRDSPAGPLSEIAAEIESDRRTLRGLMAALNLRPSLLKTVIGWFGEKAGRVKLNDRLFDRSPLIGLLDLELLIGGVSGKLQLWRALAEVASADSRLEQFDFTALGRRAEEQRRRLEELHGRAAREALGRDH